ncbi:hypothetical cytosolic protein [Syntrophus aciditrophicus SB]|uniref:Hypothetical cytosolic protein n=1 Tax=Syntrophus aciditrophicus (strain SB) TaxID=56780 RepID=Q2LVS8_SYNAS|nr:hypothetical cytosolic protein [Syntrophus aciditrophicus SB]
MPLLLFSAVYRQSGLEGKNRHHYIFIRKFDLYINELFRLSYKGNPDLWLPKSLFCIRLHAGDFLCRGRE